MLQSADLRQRQPDRQRHRLHRRRRRLQHHLQLSTATLSGGTNTFNLPIYVPYTLVASLAGNASFDQVYIEAGTISSGTLALNLIGSNPNMSYVFASGFTVAAGGTMAVGANVPVVVESTLSDAGARDLLQR